MDATHKRPELAHSETVEELPAACASELAAVEFLEKRRWKGCPCCMHCGSVNVYAMTDAKTGGRNKRFLWRCRDCEKQYTVRVGTVMEDSPIPLRHWVRAMWEASSGKNGVSALEISRKLQISYKAALFLMHRIRCAMAEIDPLPPLTGSVEADETYVGGKPRRRGWKPGQAKQPREKWTDKAPVLAAVERGGQVRARVVATVNHENVVAFLRDTVSTKAQLLTDEAGMYQKPGTTFARGHQTVKHSVGEYVNAENPHVHTNTVEGFFSKVKRGLDGVFHSVSKEHLPKYMAHFVFLYNSRGLNDGQRVDLLVSRTDGRRLTYAQSKATA